MELITLKTGVKEQLGFHLGQMDALTFLFFFFFASLLISLESALHQPAGKLINTVLTYFINGYIIYCFNL